MPDAFLAIECSHGSGSLALRPARGAAIERRAVPAPDSGNDHLMAEIDALVRGAGLAPRDLGAIAVSHGPGGFTGLRVSCATAMAIADVVGCALVAVPSALSVARDAAREGRAADGTCAVVLAAKARDAWCSEVAISGGMPSLVREGILALDAIRRLPGTILADLRAPGAGGWAAEVPAVQATWSAAACLEVGERMLAEGLGVGALGLLPRYPRRPEAELLWETRHPGGAAKER